MRMREAGVNMFLALNSFFFYFVFVFDLPPHA